MSDEKAKDLLYEWYGFAKEKIKIHRTLPRYEVNRHRQLRKVGEIDRAPLYNATDWNYIRFDCGCMSCPRRAAIPARVPAPSPVPRSVLPWPSELSRPRSAR